MMDLLSFLAARLKEPSTYASLATFAALMHVNIDPGLWKDIALYGGIVASVCGFLSTENGKPLATIVQDAGAALANASPQKDTPPNA